MDQHLLNKLKSEDSEFEVVKGNALVLKTNATFILKNCLAIINLSVIKSFYLVSKNNYLIGVFVELSDSLFTFFPSQTACRLAIINLVELCLYKLIKESTNANFSLDIKNIVAANIISFYFIADTQNLTNCNLSNLKTDKVTQILKRYDQSVWI